MQLDKFIGNGSIPLEHRVLNIMLVFGIVLLASNIIFNYIFNFTVSLVVCLICCVTLLGIYYVSRFTKKYLVARPLAIALIYIITPIIWIYNGGTWGGLSFYIFIFSSMIVILFYGVKRIILMGCLLAITLMLIVVEYTNPSLIVGYITNFDRYSDYTFSLLSALIINLYLYVVMLDEYNREHKQARKYEVLIEEKNREIEMARLDRLHLVGEMAASIGHEVRNPLTTVRGFLQLMQGKKKYVDDRENFEIMIEELDRTNSIITEFLSLAKNKTFQLKNDNLNRIVEVIFPLLTADSLRLGKKFRIELGDIPDLLLDENEIRQCIINLVRNGLEAVDNNGQVCLSTYFDGENVILAVQDNGSGIPAEVYNKLGIPFVTTKSYGTGLGIPICFKIAERHNAKIEVATSSKGTIIKVMFKTTGE